jgi:hypothetical protein
MTEPTVAYWKGKTLEECSREELYECIEKLGRVCKDHYSPLSMRARALGKVEMIKRGEGTD